MASGNPIALLGTTHGVVRFEDDTVGLLSSDGESVRALARVPGGELLAGSDEGGIFASSRKGVEWRRVARLPHGISSLVRIPGPKPRLVVLDAAGSIWSGSPTRGDFELRLEAVEGDCEEPPELLRLPTSASHLVLVDPRRERLWRSTDGGTSFAVHGDELPGSPTRLSVHPGDSRLWMLGLDCGLAQSSDGGRSFHLMERPKGCRVRRVALHRPTDPVILAVTEVEPGGEPETASALWLGKGTRIGPIARGVLDSVRDPSGVILSAVWAQRNREDVVLLGTNRGELLLVDPNRVRCELLAEGLGEIRVMLTGGGGMPMDPEGSGIHLLP